MSMGFEDIRLAIESRMHGWIEAPVAYDGVPASPDVVTAQRNKSPWVRVTINHGDSFTASIGHRPCVRRTGLIMCQIFTPERQGSRPAALLADSLAERLEYYQDSHFETQAASVQRIGPSDGYYQYNLVVPWRAD